MRKFAILLLLAFLTIPLFAQRKVTIKIASPIPESTPWGKFLNEVANDWRKITNGEVDVIIYHNGVAGTEKDVVRSLKVNQIHAALLSTLGLYEISPEVMTLSCPFLIRDDDELDLVLSGLRSDLEEKLNTKGFVTLAWARVGWVRFFSKQPVFVPADLKRQKLGTNNDQAELNHVFRTMGFQMIPVGRNEILVALNSNMVDAVFQSPVAVGSTQVFGLAKNMASINIAPFLGGIVFSQRAWQSIPDKYKPQMIDSLRRNEAGLDRAVRTLETDMINTMGNYGLVVNRLSPEQEQLWYDEIGRVMPSLIGTLFDPDIYKRIETIVQARRNRSR